MPNWCNNNLTITGPEEEVARFVVDARNRPQFYRGEFEIDNERLRGMGKPEKTLQEALGPEEELCFHAIVPIPDGILAGRYDPDGYNMENALWGTKWGSAHSEITVREEGRVIYLFETAWAPPLKFLETASESYPSLTFTLVWEEPGMVIAGRHVFVDGEITEAEENKGEEFEVTFTVKYTAKVVSLRALLDNTIGDISIPENEDCSYKSDSFEVDKITDSNGEEIEEY